jgi:hypothetical protein
MTLEMKGTTGPDVTSCDFAWDVTPGGTFRSSSGLRKGTPMQNLRTFENAQE